MNLAFLAPEFLPNWGGAGSYAASDFKQHLFKLKTELKLGDLDANKIHSDTNGLPNEYNTIDDMLIEEVKRL